MARLKPLDMRGFLAERRREGAGARTLGRSLAGIRSFVRFLEQQGLASSAGLKITRAPRQPKTLPKPVAASQAIRMTQAGEHLDGEPWIGARDAAILSLLYGCGLRIGEALAMTPADLEKSTSGTLMITGKGGKTRMVPLLSIVGEAIAQYRSLCPFRAGAGRAPVSRRQGRNAAPRHHRKIRRAAARRARPAALRDSPCAAPTPSPRTCWPAVATCARSRNCSATPSLSTTQIYTAVDTQRLLDVYAKAHPRAAG